MVQMNKKKWGYFKANYKEYGFEYFPKIPKLREEILINRKYNIMIVMETRIVTSFHNVNNEYHKEFDLILLMEREGLLDLNSWKDARMQE